MTYWQYKKPLLSSMSVIKLLIQIIDSMVYEILPPGVKITTSSPTLFPSIACPSGDSLEMRPVFGSASLDPTIENSRLIFSSAFSFTVLPTSTETAVSLELSIISAFFTIVSSSAIRPSVKDCSFFASAYSAFSDKSPSSFASCIRSAITFLFTFFSSSSSRMTFLKPSPV